jgi:hypothetical protein
MYLGGGLITVSGKIVFLAHERSFPNLLYNNTEMIQLICDSSTAEKIRPFNGMAVKITGQKYACSLLLANGTRPIPLKPTVTTTAPNPTPTPDISKTKGARKMALIFFYFADDSSVPQNDPKTLTDIVFDPYDGLNALFRYD